MSMSGVSAQPAERDRDAMDRQSATLHLISGVGAKGPACFVIETAGKRLMLDLGEGPPPGLLPDVAAIGAIDALILSHGHKDHVGGLSLLPQLGNPPIYGTEIVAQGLPKGITAHPLPVGGRADILGIAVETGRNGHAPGGIWLHFEIGGGLLYTGDISTESILYAYDPPTRAADTALIDCSYGDYQKPRAACRRDLMSLIQRRPALLPVPADGRGPEIAVELLREGRTEIYVDDAMLSALRTLSGDGSISLNAAIDDDIKRLAVAVKPIAQARGVMLAASADGTSGATARLLARWEHTETPAIVFTGYVNPGTPAERLVKSVRAQTMRWNVHPRLSDTTALVRALQAKTVVPAFCSRTYLAALSAVLAPARVTMDGPLAIG